MSETPIGDDVMGPEVVQAVQDEPADFIAMTDPYRIPGEDDPDDPDAETATESDALAETTDNSEEVLPAGYETPQQPDAVQDNANELDGDEPDGEE